MARPSNQGFQKDLANNVDVDRGARRVYSLLEPQEAQYLLDFLEDVEIDEAETEINQESLMSRLQLTADGHPAPQSGEAAFYQ
jgi:hypothetical protein